MNKLPELFSFLFGKNLYNSSLYEVLKKHNIILSHSQRALDTVFVNAKEAKSLETAKGYPLLRIESVIQNADKTVTNLCRKLCTGDKFKFTV